MLHESLLGAQNLQPWGAKERNITEIIFSVFSDVSKSSHERYAAWRNTPPARRMIFGFVARLSEPGLGLIREARFLACVNVRNVQPSVASK